MLTVTTFRAEHLRSMDLPASQVLGADLMSFEILELESTFAFTGFIGGEVVACAGVSPVWRNRGFAWAALSPRSGPHMRPITRAVALMLDAAPFQRVEAAVRCDFSAGRRWLRLLGFELEATRMRAFCAGTDHALYARVRPCSN